MDNFFDVKKSQLYIKKLITPSDKIVLKIRNKVLNLFYLRGFFHTVFDKYTPYEKYQINRKFIPLDIEKEISEYDKLNF